MSGEISSNDSSFPVKDSLSKEKQDLIAHFHEIVGNLDYNESVKIMIENKWNLEQAIHKIMDIPISIELSDSVSLSGYQEHPESVNPLISFEGVRRRNFVLNTPVEVKPFNQKIIKYSSTAHQSWYWQILTLVWSPFQKIIEMFMYFFTAFQSDPRLTIVDSAQDVKTFILQLKSEMSPLVLPDFISQPYGHCIADAKEKLQYLVVYLHDNTSDCVNIVRDVLCSEEFKTLIREENLLLWGCSVQKPEGYRVAQTLRQHSYPFIGLIGMQSNHKLALLARIEGGFERTDLITKLRLVLRDFEAPIVAARNDREERIKTQHLRLQQDVDYAESLRLDREKEHLLQEKRNTERQIEAQRKEEELIQEKQITEAARIRHLISDKLSPILETEDDTILIRIQMPSQQFSERFYITDSLKMLYYVIKSNQCSPWNFQVSSNFPKKVWPCVPNVVEYEDSEIIRKPRPGFSDPPSFKEFGITTNMTVMVIDQDA